MLFTFSYHFLQLFLLIVYFICRSLNTPPGTKILIKSGTLPVSHGLLLLTPLVYVLGGKVANLIEKWELNKVNQIYFIVNSI